MPEVRRSRSTEIHDALDHPVIDVDGHTIDFMPVLEDYVREFTGKKGVEWYRRSHPWYDADRATRISRRIPRPLTWGYPAFNTLDHITGVVPALLEERLGEIGIDFTVIYPSPTRTAVPGLADGDLRQGMCRALNTYQRDTLAPHAGHMTPAAVIPMHTPTEAIEELEYAVTVLGMKTTQMTSYVLRPDGSGGNWWDNLCIDSAYDYDPVWAKCLELKVAPAFHTGTSGLASRTSPSSSIYNHIGHFAAGQESICKAFFLSGVTYRFPELRVAFLESGVGWAALLYSDLVDHFESRNYRAIRRYFDPSLLDEGYGRELFDRYASPAFAAKADRFGEIAERFMWPHEAELTERDLDEFTAIGIEKVEDVRDRFVPNFFFGCEGEDRSNVLAFDERILPHDARLKIVYGSDIAHMSTHPLAEVLEEAYELVENGQLDKAAFRDLMFRNPVDLCAGTNPNFFAGTSIESKVAEELSTIPTLPARGADQ